MDYKLYVKDLITNHPKYKMQAEILGDEKVRDDLAFLDLILSRSSNEQKDILERLMTKQKKSGTALNKVGLTRSTFYRRINQILSEIAELFEKRDEMKHNEIKVL